MYYLYIYEKNLYDYFSKSDKVIINNLFEINVVKKKKPKKENLGCKSLNLCHMSLFLKKISAKSLVTQLTPLIFLTKTLRFKSSSPIVSIELKKKKI